MTLCFAALIKVLKICAKPKVYNKTLCGAVVKSLDEYYGGILESDDSTVSHLLSCDYNLSPVDVIEPMQKTDLLSLSRGMEKHVIPLLNPDMIPLAILSLKDLALSTVSADEARIGILSRADLVLKVSFNPADFFADIFYFVATGIENKAGKETIDKVTEDYVNSFQNEVTQLNTPIIPPEEKAEMNFCLPKLTENDKALLKMFHDNFDDIVKKYIECNRPDVWLADRSSGEVGSLCSKWRDRVAKFEDISLQADVLHTLATLQELCNALDPDSELVPAYPVRKFRTELRNCYVKIHPEQYAGIFPYEAFIDDWNDGEDF